MIATIITLFIAGAVAIIISFQRLLRNAKTPNALGVLAFVFISADDKSKIK